MWQESHQRSQLLICSLELQRVLELQLQLCGEVALLYAGEKNNLP